ncbi:hypothetical protein [Streptomyces sp. NBC_01320]|uniref:hypothetical protein n=1 Tax=Streptomyces sp. NBC_01320 TaxID=2903824 RepID=UPI002E15BEE7|nr:hypothetical protein OG395_29755 [Streptomyces sp. NBC_01320]
MTTTIGTITVSAGPTGLRWPCTAVGAPPAGTSPAVDGDGPAVAIGIPAMAVMAPDQQRCRSAPAREPPLYPGKFPGEFADSSGQKHGIPPYVTRLAHLVGPEDLPIQPYRILQSTGLTPAAP